MPFISIATRSSRCDAGLQRPYGARFLKREMDQRWQHARTAREHGFQRACDGSRRRGRDEAVGRCCSIETLPRLCHSGSPGMQRAHRCEGADLPLDEDAIQCAAGHNGSFTPQRGAVRESIPMRRVNGRFTVQSFRPT
jgi:hypothetical protein